jgi:inhibitor of KinA
MQRQDPHIFPLGDSALTVEFGTSISIEYNDLAISFARYMDEHPFDGYVESVPAYSSISIFYDPVRVAMNTDGRSTAYDLVERLVRTALPSLAARSAEGAADLIDILVHFDSESSPDLPYVAERSGMTEMDVIDVFTAREYRVYMIGFLPGFSYMGEVDERIAVPRRETPRTKVPKGSVGIAGRQTGVYSLESPGGWQLIGRTDTEMFLPGSQPPSLLKPGDVVRFVPIG